MLIRSLVAFPGSANISLENDHFMKGPPLATVNHGFMPSPLKALRFSSDIITDLKGEQCISQFNEWISECESGHPKCRSQSLTPLPHRVIDVGSEDLNQDPRLYESKREMGRYIALSHCWGTAQHFTTEKKTLAQRLRGMHWAVLPKTFQDAIFLTRKLGIRYIWIDSLCIIQDDSADWDMELSNMCDIYRKSFLTIAAASAENHQSGFLGLRTNLSMELDPKYRNPRGLRVREIIDGAGSMPIEDPLSTRAWAFQERLVPQRILSFGSQQVSWECNSSTLNQCGYHFDDLNSMKITKEIYHSNLRPSSPRPKILLDSAVYDFWRQSIVPAYAKLDLTKERDKLPALSAVANEVKQIVKDDYLAGMWRRDLLTSLLWTSASNRTPKPGWLPYKYRAPSWSWASIDSTTINFENNAVINEFEFKILDVHCQLNGVNSTGEVSHGFMKIMCRWLPATLEIDGSQMAASDVNADRSQFRDPDESHRILGFPTPCAYLWECFPDVPLEEEQTLNAEGTPKNTLRRSDRKPSADRPAMSGAVSCLLLARTGQEAIFLIVGESRAHNGAFERLGLLRAVPEDRFWENWYDHLEISQFTIV